MNGSYYPNPTFPTINNEIKEPVSPPSNESIETKYFEISYIENILRLNKGKKVTVYASFPDADEWKNKVISGIIEEAGRDHLLLNDVVSGKWFLVPMIYINFFEFDEEVNYDYRIIYKSLL